MKMFNPKKCPYKQLADHKGEAIVLVVREKNGRRSRKYLPKNCKINRLRYVSSKEVTVEGERAFSHYDHIGSDDYLRDNLDTSSSCFDYELSETRTYRKVIEGMRKYDEASGLKILYIEFRNFRKGE